jgi:hypothetical protein
MGVRIALVVAAISRHQQQQQIVFATHASHRNFHHELAVDGCKHPSGGAAQRHTGSECLSVCLDGIFSTTSAHLCKVLNRCYNSRRVRRAGFVFKDREHCLLARLLGLRVVRSAQRCCWEVRVTTQVVIQLSRNE